MTQIILTEESSIVEALRDWGVEAIKAELQKTIDFSSRLKITDADTPAQFQIIKNTKNGYVKSRNTIKRWFKSRRDYHNEMARENLAAEREVLADMEKEENRLAEIIAIKELEALRLENEKCINDRMKALTDCNVVPDRNKLLDMKEKDFVEFLQDKQAEYAENQERIRLEEEARIAREKELEEARKQAAEEAERRAEVRAKELADREAERVAREKEEAEYRAKRELQRLEDEKNAEIAQMKKVQEEKEKNIRDKERRDELEKEAALRQKLIDENSIKAPTESFWKNIVIDTKTNERLERFIRNTPHDKQETLEDRIVFYKKVWEFIL